MLHVTVQCSCYSSYSIKNIKIVYKMCPVESLAEHQHAKECTLNVYCIKLFFFFRLQVYFLFVSLHVRKRSELEANIYHFRRCLQLKVFTNGSDDVLFVS